ncbi:MFS transporter [Sphingobacteriaceae bacterium]|nr:MFS transporter [Sphingobacteriaceae bacterium]
MEETFSLEDQPQTNQSKLKFTRYEVSIILLLALTQFTVVLDFMVMAPLGDMLTKSMGLTTGQFGFVVSGYAFSAGVSGLLTAGFADKFDRKRLLLFFYIGFIIGTLFCALATNYETLITARIFTGLFGGVIGSISMTIITDIFSLDKRGTVVGFVQMGFGASQILGIPISLFLANTWGWKTPFLMIVCLATLIWLVILIRIQPITKHLEIKSNRNALTHLWLTIKQRRYRIGFLATSLLSVGSFMILPWGSTFAINNLHVSQDRLPILFMVGGVSALFIMPLVGKLSDKIDKLKLFGVASLWMIVTVLIYTNLTPVPFYMAMVCYVLMMIGIMSRMVPSMALVTSLPQIQDRGAFMSINSSLHQIAGGVAATMGGSIVYQQDRFSPLEHYNTLGIVAALLSLVGVFFIYRVNQIIKTRIPE